jgi:hypothetical protein
MTMPKFTAEASLYLTSGSYHSSGPGSVMRMPRQGEERKLVQQWWCDDYRCYCNSEPSPDDCERLIDSRWCQGAPTCTGQHCVCRKKAVAIDGGYVGEP